jgi:hypothetical protein
MTDVKPTTEDPEQHEIAVSILLAVLRLAL